MIRNVTRKDKKAIEAVARSTESFKEHEVQCCLEMVDEAIEPSYILTTFECYEEDGEVVGFVSYGEDEMTEGTWEVYWVATRKDKQGHGIGKKLMLHAEEKAKMAGARQLVLETSSQENYAHIRRFYEKLGYVKAATVPDYFAIGDHKEIYVKRL